MARMGIPRYGTFVRGLGVVGLALAAAAPAGASGFSAFDSGVKAMGFSGAFTAQASDPTAVFYNLGGLALLEQGKLTGGSSGVYLNESQFRGTTPGIASGTAGEQEPSLAPQVHAYAVKAFGQSKKLKWGTGVYTPFAFETEWADPESFSGRLITTDAQLQTYDVTTSLAYPITKNFGFGAGVTYRSSTFDMGRRIDAFNPNNFENQDIGSFVVETDSSDGIGWSAGLLNRIGGFSWGLSYRSAIEIAYTGSGKLTQILTGDDQFDELNALIYPYDKELPLTTTISFPDTATLGLAFATENFLIEADASQTGWSRFEGMAVTFPANPTFSQNLQGAYEDAMSYRLGLQLGLAKGMKLRFGYALEESPQPDESVAPLFPDAERSIFSLGFGRDWLDIGFQFVSPSDRTTLTNADTFNGTYSGNTYILGISATKK